MKLLLASFFPGRGKSLFDAIRQLQPAGAFVGVQGNEVFWALEGSQEF